MTLFQAIVFSVCVAYTLLDLIARIEGGRF